LGSIQNGSFFFSEVASKRLKSPGENKGCHTVALPLTLKGIVRQKKNYGNSNISSCKNIVFKKFFQRNQKSFKIL
jgi:hypothetical protein